MSESIWQGWEDGELQVHFIHTGVGEAIFFIFPDGTTMLEDCGDHPALTRLELSVPVVPNPGRLAGDWVARYIKRVLPRDCPKMDGRPLIDYMVLSHFHSDHCGTVAWQSVKPGGGLPGCRRSGFSLAAEELSFKVAVDRGYPDYALPTRESYPEDELDVMLRLYSVLEKRDGLQRQAFRLGATDQFVPLRNPAAVSDFVIKNITGNGKILCRDGSVRDLYAEYFKKYPQVNENGMSLGFLLQYGKFSLYLNGDFSDNVPQGDDATISTEEALAPHLPSVDVAKVNHHGYYSMPAKLVSALSPQVWTACVWDQLHMLDVVLERLSDRALYPGNRMIFPSVFPKERCAAAKGKTFLNDIAPESMEDGCHVVITVPRGGETFRVTCISALDEKMRVLKEYHFQSGANSRNGD